MIDIKQKVHDFKFSLKSKVASLKHNLHSRFPKISQKVSNFAAPVNDGGFWQNIDKEELTYWGKRAALIILIFFIWVYLFSPFDNLGKKDETTEESDQEVAQTQSDNTGEDVKGATADMPTDGSTSTNVMKDDKSPSPDDDSTNEDTSDQTENRNTNDSDTPQSAPSTSPSSPASPDTDTSPDTTPSPSNPSTNLKPNGQSCTTSSQCYSGYCVDDVCCNNSCQGSCMRCDSYDGSAGICHNIENGNDPDNECQVGEYTCKGKCSMVRSDGACDGSGACDTNSDVKSVSRGYVCDGGEEVEISPTQYCFRGDDCDDGDCMATQWFTGCDGEGSCRSSDQEIIEGVTYVDQVRAEDRYTLTDNCETQGTSFCENDQPGRCDLSGCRIMKTAYRCEETVHEGVEETTSECSYDAGLTYEYCSLGQACQKGECSPVNVCDADYIEYPEVGDSCQSTCNGMGMCNTASNFCEESFLITNLPEGLSVYKNEPEGSREIDLTKVPQLGEMEVAIWKGDDIIATMPIEFNDSNLDWDSLIADTTDGKAFLHYPGGITDLPGIKAVSYALYIPKSEGEEVIVCPHAQNLEEVEGSCEDGFLLEPGDKVDSSSDPISIEEIDGSEYWKVPGLTSTGAFTLAGIKDTCSRLQVSQESNHAIRFMPTFSIDSSDDTIVVDFVPNQTTTDGTTDYDFNSIGIDDIELEDDGVSKNLASSASNGVWGVSIDALQDRITFSAPSDASAGEIDSGSVVYVNIGTDVGGDTRIINPSVVQSYDLSLRLTNGSNVDFGEAEIPIVDDDTVNVRGYIDTVLTFDIDTASIQADSLDVDTIQWQNSNTIRYSMNAPADLASLDPGQYLQVTSAGNSKNNGMFEISAVDDVNDYVEVINLRREGNGDDEASDSSAEAFGYVGHCDSSAGDACESYGGAGDAAGYVVDLGEMTYLGPISKSGNLVFHSDGGEGDINYIWFDIETNASSGGVVTMTSANEALVMDGSNQIDDVTDGDERLISSGSGLYGINHPSTAINYSYKGLMNVAWDCDCSNGDDYYCDVSDGGTPIQLFDTNGGPIDDGRIQFAIGASPNNAHPTGTYNDQLTFIATSNF